MIEGAVYNGDPSAPLAGWTVQAVGEFGTSSAVTNAQGAYSIPGLAAGTYTICIVEQTGWVTQMPMSSAPCPSGTGYTFSVVETDVFGSVDFAMLPL